jgi:hypothetical protein
MMKKNFRSGFFAGIAIVVFLVPVPSAQAVDFKISGQINRAILWADNGHDDEHWFVDNDNSSSRFRFTGSNDFDNNFSVGIVWEVEMQSNASNNLDIDDDTDLGDVTFDERKLEFYVGHTYGRVWLGQGSMASDGTAEVDLSGTDVITSSEIADMAGGVTFRGKDDKNTIIAAIGDVFGNFDGLGRRDRVRYDTPKFGPAYFSASTGNGDIWDVAGRVAYEFGEFGKLAAAAAYADGKSRFGWNQYDGSASFLHSSGLNLTGAFGVRDFDASGKDDGQSYFVKLGFTRGKHAVSVDYTMTEDLDVDGDEADSIGVGYVFNAWESIQFYGGWRIHMLERDNISDPDDISAVMIGGRVKF